MTADTNQHENQQDMESLWRVFFGTSFDIMPRRFQVDKGHMMRFPVLYTSKVQDLSSLHR